MKRRNFLKGLVALALAPVAALSKEDSSPAKNGFVSDQTVLNTTKPNRNYDIFVMPERDEIEVYEDNPYIHHWKQNPNLDMEELYELGREELRCYTEQGCAILDNRRVLLAEF
jgi:hypothetical protein